MLSSPSDTIARSPLQPSEGSEAPSAAKYLGAVRWAFVAILVLTSVLMVLAAPARYQELTTIFANLSPAQELVLRNLGISRVLDAGLVFLVEYGVIAAFVVVGVFIFLRSQSDYVAMLVALGLVTYMAWTSPPLDALLGAGPALALPVTVVQAIGAFLSEVLFLIFPDGRFVPRWSRWLVPVLVAMNVAWVLFPDSLFNFANPFRLSVAGFAVLMGIRAVCVAFQLYRYVRVATPVQRQQTKWIISGVTVAVIGYLVFGFDRFALPLLAEARMAAIVYDLVGVPLFLLTTLAIPFTFAHAILKYHLYEIDLIINRTLVYGTLTAILAGTYIAAINLSQRVFVALTGERSDAAIVLTTLVVASAFTPVRNRLQAFVDLHFKEATDPVKELRSITHQMRTVLDVVDLDNLVRRVLQEAVRAFHATGGAVYLRRDKGIELAYVDGAWHQIEGMTAWLRSGEVEWGWIVLGPRHDGSFYTGPERAAFVEMASEVARAVLLISRTGARIGTTASPTSEEG